MEAPDAVAALAALAHEHRLAVFRLLMRAGSAGLPAGEIAEKTGLAPSTLSFHLSALERAGLLSATRRQRHILYAVNTEGARDLVDFLTRDCCGGRPEICGLGQASQRKGRAA